jgi:hypothetical protein
MTVRSTLAKLHGRTATGVPRWALRTAYAITLTTLPSCVWRLSAIILGAPLLERTMTSSAGRVSVDAGQVPYVLTLCVVSESLAFLAMGLVSEWGEVWPRWIPGLGGRRVPVSVAVVPAGLGSLLLLIFPYTLFMTALQRKLNGAPTALIVHGWQTVVFWLAYAPLAAWGPLLAGLTVHYYRRRHGTRVGAAGSGNARALSAR